MSLTPRGEIVVNYARRMLSINDEIVHLTGGRPSAQTLRVSIPGDFGWLPNTPDARRLPQALARRPFQRQRHQLRQHAARSQAGRSRSRGRDLQSQAHHRGASSLDRPGGVGAQRRHHPRPGRPGAAGVVRRRLLCRYTAVHALHRVGRDCDFVFTARSVRSSRRRWPPVWASWCCRAPGSRRPARRSGGCAAAGAARALLRDFPARRRQSGGARGTRRRDRAGAPPATRGDGRRNAAVPEVPPAAASGSG